MSKAKALLVEDMMNVRASIGLLLEHSRRLDDWLVEDLTNMSVVLHDYLKNLDPKSVPQ